MESNIEKVINDILKELKFTAEHPEKGKFNSTHEGLGVILEEFEEFKDAIFENRVQGACNEAIQVAAMAIRFILDFSE